MLSQMTGILITLEQIYLMKTKFELKSEHATEKLSKPR